MYQIKIYTYSFISAFILVILYIFGYISQIRSILSDIITFNAATFGFLMVFFTVLQSVVSHELFSKMEKFRPNLTKDIFKQIKYLLLWSIFLFLYVLLIKILVVSLMWLKIIGIFILFFSVLNLCIGLYFLLKDIYEVIVEAF